DLWQTIRSAIAASATTQTQDVGGVGSNNHVYRDVPSEGGVLVGFVYATGLFVPGRAMIDSLQPIYMTERGEALGAAQGKSKSQFQRLRARTGYVVTAVHLRTSVVLDGFS